MTSCGLLLLECINDNLHSYVKTIDITHFQIKCIWNFKNSSRYIHKLNLNLLLLSQIVNLDFGIIFSQHKCFTQNRLCKKMIGEYSNSVISTTKSPTHMHWCNVGASKAYAWVWLAGTSRNQGSIQIFLFFLIFLKTKC